LFYIGAAVLAAIAALGTFARTAVIGGIVLGVMYCARSQRKVLTLTICALVASVVAYGASDAWSTRINTIQNYDQNNSALGRILVWGWTLGYVQEHPLGGSFDVYKISRIQFPATPTESEGQEVVGRAFHSIYFEVLGELGWVGLGLFVGLILSSLALLQSVVRRARDLSHIAWTRDLAIALQASLVTLAACGAFIGIAFEPMLYYLSALAVCLREYVRRVEQEAAIA